MGTQTSFTFILARLTRLQQLFFFLLYISSDEERLHSLIENTVEINVFPTASLHLLQILDWCNYRLRYLLLCLALISRAFHFWSWASGIFFGLEDS